MRRQDHVIEFEQWIVVIDRLLLEYVEGGSGDSLVLQRLNQRGFVDDWPTGSVDQVSGWLHAGDQLATDQAFGFRGQGALDDDVVRALDQVIQLNPGDVSCIERGVRIVGEHCAVEDGSQANNFPTDVAEADHTECFAHQPRTDELVFGCPGVTRAHCTVLIENAVGQSKHKCHGCLSHREPDTFRRIGDDDSAIRTCLEIHRVIANAPTADGGKPIVAFQALGCELAAEHDERIDSAQLFGREDTRFRRYRYEFDLLGQGKEITLQRLEFGITIRVIKICCDSDHKIAHNCCLSIDCKFRLKITQPLPLRRQVLMLPVQAASREIQGPHVRHIRAFLRRTMPALLALFLFVPLFTTTSAQTADPSTLDLVSSTRYIVIDDATGEIFAEKDADIRGGMASLTKVFTALVAIERASSLDQVIVAQDSDMFDSTSTTMTGFFPGVAFTVEDLLYGMILESGNDAAEALARGIAEQPGDTPEQSVERFVGWMNDKVAELGLTNTNFVNPHGLSDPDHYSTPREIAAFMMVATQNPIFFTVITTRSFTTSTGAVITSVNRGPEFMASYIGGKTGFDEETGYCLIEIAQRDDVRLVSVTIDGVAPDVWYEDHAILLEYGFNSLNDRLAAGQPLGGNVIQIAQAQTDDPPDDVAEVEPTAAVDVAIGEVADESVGPVRIDGTPVPVPQAETDEGGMFDNWAIAVLLGLVIFGLLVMRSGVVSGRKKPTDESTD